MYGRRRGSVGGGQAGRQAKGSGEVCVCVYVQIVWDCKRLVTPAAAAHGRHCTGHNRLIWQLCVSSMHGAYQHMHGAYARGVCTGRMHMRCLTWRVWPMRWARSSAWLRAPPPAGTGGGCVGAAQASCPPHTHVTRSNLLPHTHLLATHQSSAGLGGPLNPTCPLQGLAAPKPYLSIAGFQSLSRSTTVSAVCACGRAGGRAGRAGGGGRAFRQAGGSGSGGFQRHMPPADAKGREGRVRRGQGTLPRSDYGRTPLEAAPGQLHCFRKRIAHGWPPQLLLRGRRDAARHACKAPRGDSPWQPTHRAVRAGPDGPPEAAGSMALPPAGSSQGRRRAWRGGTRSRARRAR